MEATDKIWVSGEYVDWEDARIHLVNHTLHYGTGVFEGIRCYDTPHGPAIFRLNDHVERLVDGAKTYKMKIPYTEEEIQEAIKDTVCVNHMTECYIRPLVYYGYGKMGVNPRGNPIKVMIAVWPWGTYLGEEGLKKGIRCAVTKWRRIDKRIMPPQAKATANYANSVLAKLDALDRGFDEAIMLNIDDYVSEGTAENIFLVKDGVVITTADEAGALIGITQLSTIQIAKDLGYEVQLKLFKTDDLFDADEVFLTGTAAEITPVREIDNNQIGIGQRGPITEKIQAKYFDVVRGKDERYYHWLNFIKKPKKLLQPSI